MSMNEYLWKSSDTAAEIRLLVMLYEFDQALLGGALL